MQRADAPVTHTHIEISTFKASGPKIERQNYHGMTGGSVYPTSLEEFYLERSRLASERLIERSPFLAFSRI